MNFKHTLMGLGLVAVAISAPLAAQAPTGWHVGGSLSYASGMSLKKEITNQDLGYILDAGYTGKLAATDVDFRTSLALEFFPGKDLEQTKHSLNGVQLAGDLFVNTPIPRLRIITGVSLNQWSLKNSDPINGSWTNSVKGVKFGGRIGMDYMINKNWSAELLMQIVELGTNEELTSKSPNGDDYGVRGVNPSWAQLGVKYHF